MAIKPLPTDFPISTFASVKALESFFEREHTTAPGIYIKLAKKSSGIPSVTAAEAVETALCFGWINGRANTFDEQYWLVRYTPRRAKSIWSRKNVATVAELTQGGRMRPAGLVAVEAAKADGRWDRAYAGPATMIIAEDFAKALESNSAAKAFFESFNKSDRYAALWRIETASVKARFGKIDALVQMLAAGKKPDAMIKARVTPKSYRNGVSKQSSKASTARRQMQVVADESQRDNKQSSHRDGLRPRP